MIKVLIITKVRLEIKENKIDLIITKDLLIDLK